MGLVVKERLFIKIEYQKIDPIYIPSKIDALIKVTSIIAQSQQFVDNSRHCTKDKLSTFQICEFDVSGMIAYREVRI